jgi:isoleucyl-tRNA synthetase
MAPILSFTADELWRFLPGQREESVHIGVFPLPAELERFDDGALLDQWAKLMAIRELVLAEIEPLRKNKQIGSSLQAKVVLSGPESELALLKNRERELPMLFIVSDVELRAPADAASAAGLRATIERAGGVKCERCWRYVAAVSSDPAWAGLCERCQQALAADRAALDPSARKPARGGGPPARNDESSAGAGVRPGAGKDING